MTRSEFDNLQVGDILCGTKQKSGTIMDIQYKWEVIRIHNAANNNLCIDIKWLEGEAKYMKKYDRDFMGEPQFLYDVCFKYFTIPYKENTTSLSKYINEIYEQEKTINS